MDLSASQGSCCTTVELAKKFNGSSSPPVHLHTPAQARHTLKSCSLCDCWLTFLVHGKILHMRDALMGMVDTSWVGSFEGIIPDSLSYDF